MNIYEERALKEFLLDSECLKQLDNWADDFNLFDVLKITNMEIRHSNILAWLFDPNENHGLGDSFIQSFMTKVVSKCDHNRYNSFDLLLQDFYSYQIYREYHHMDLVLLSREEKTVCIIENKIWAGESPTQLNEYREKAKKEYLDCDNIIYIFLTPDGRVASDPENWIAMSYGEVVEALETVVKAKKVRDEVGLVIANYISTVRKNVMREKDPELVKVCNEIYNKHRSALKLIFENVNINNSIEHEIICETLRELGESGEIIFEDKNKWQFFSSAMDEFLPPLKSPVSSWGSKWVYYYWLEKVEDKLVLHLELGGWNLSEELAKRSNLLIEATGKKLDKYRYKRIYYKAVKLSDDDYEESLRKATETLVKSALKDEKKLLSMVKENTSRK